MYSSDESSDEEELRTAVFDAITLVVVSITSTVVSSINLSLLKLFSTTIPEISSIMLNVGILIGYLDYISYKISYIPSLSCIMDVFCSTLPIFFSNVGSRLPSTFTLKNNDSDCSSFSTGDAAASFSTLDVDAARMIIRFAF